VLWYDGGEEGVGISAQTRSVAGDKSLRHASRRSLTHSLDLGDHLSLIDHLLDCETTRDFDRIFASARGGFEVDSGSAKRRDPNEQCCVNKTCRRIPGRRKLKQKMEVREPARWAR